MSKAPVYASDPDQAPDSEFVAGELRHLVVGNRGRLLDARRTPVTVVEVAPQRGAFVVRIESFEDAGARWELWLKEVSNFQFMRSAASADSAQIGDLERSVACFDRELVVESSEATRKDSLRRLAQRRQHVRGWLRARLHQVHVDFGKHVARRQGSPAFYELLDDFLAERNLTTLEHAFTTTYVTHPRSGEVVKGHAIALAELGLFTYHGPTPRDPDLFAGEWTRESRADHLLWRLAFTQESFKAIGATEVPLYRAAATDTPLASPSPSALVSATFSKDVADAHFEGGHATQTAVLWRQVLPIDRLLLSFLETRAMNERFHEAEALLLADPTNQAF